MNAGPSTLAELRHALALTGEMLDAARVGDWARVGLLDAERRELLLREAPIGPESERILRDVLAADAEVAQRLAAAREAVARAWDESRRAHRALGAYGRATQG